MWRIFTLIYYTHTFSTVKISHFILSIICAGAGVNCASAAGLTFSGGDAITVIPDKSTGLDAIYILKNTAGVEASYTADNASDKVEWNSFDHSGLSQKPFIWVIDGTRTFINLTGNDTGIAVTEAGRPHYYWIVNYDNHRMDVSSIAVSPESDCSNAVLTIDGAAPAITYYTINRVPKELDREIKVAYTTMEYDDSSEAFQQVETTRNASHLSSTLPLPAPLCDTRFTLSGDRFLRQWDEEQTVATDYYQAIAVDLHTSATQTQRDNDNEVGGGADSLGGSAPVEINFKAEVTEAPQFTEWQFSRDPEFNSIDLRFNDLDFDYVFEDYGDTYIRFQCANGSGTCDQYSETYTVSVSESKLQCPNAFSPNGDGVNDLWKVSYKSIVEFECTIFNRWGVKIIELNDPSEGWDGRYKGKLVNSGVYYYVIKALGSDGVKYELAGDINIINYKQGNGIGSGDSGSSSE